MKVSSSFCFNSNSKFTAGAARYVTVFWLTCKHASSSLSPSLSSHLYLVTERPEIHTQPPPELTLHPGQELRLVVVATGPGNIVCCSSVEPLAFPVAQGSSRTCSKLVALFAGNLSYQWFRDSQAMTYATLGELVLPQVALGDQGVYSCRVTSNFGGSILSDSCHVSSERCCAHIKY